MDRLSAAQARLAEIHDSALIPQGLLLQGDPSEASIRTYLRSARILVALFGEQIVGVCCLSLRESDGEIMNLSVQADLQGRGLGKALLEFAFGLARGDGIRTLRICTGNSSIGPLALYRKAGFRIVGIDRDYFAREYPRPIVENGIQCRDRLILECNLEPP